MAEVRNTQADRSARRLFAWMGRLVGRPPAQEPTEQQQKKRIPVKAVKCDLCRGYGSGPACVSACPYGAIDLINPNRYLTHALEGER
jgi:Fe-S-cluster-containing hydrogenase component 2